MSASNRIVLHVGAPKTGSTYLQRRLRADPAHLRNQGIYVPVLPAVAAMAGNAKLLATILSRVPSLSFQRAFPHVDLRELQPKDVVAELLSGWRQETESVILSAENFRPNHAYFLRDLLPRSVPCNVVLFVRRQDLWIESYFNQLTKTGDITENIHSFVAKLCDTDGERFCRPDWHSHYGMWKEAFGNCNVVFYDEGKDDIFGAFIAAAGLPPVRGLADIEPAQVSLNIYELAYLMALERSLPFADFVRRRSASAEASRRLPPPQRFTLLAKADYERLQQRFGASNDRLLEALGRSEDTHLLRLTRPAQPPCHLPELYASAAYARHRELADAIFAGHG
jgi:hypothetical protein